MKKLLTLIALSLIVSASIAQNCGTDSAGQAYCCNAFGFCWKVKKLPSDPIIMQIEPETMMLPSYIPDSLIRF